MLNKEKRSLVLSLIIGDGCLTNIRNSGILTVVHGNAQKDLLEYKATLLQEATDRNINVRKHNSNSHQIAVCMRRFRSWKKFCYKNGKKSIPDILRFVTNPTQAALFMLADDGYCEPSKFRDKSTGEYKNSGFRFRLFFCDQTEEQLQQVINWFKTNFNVLVKVHYRWDKHYNKYYPYLKFNQAGSLIIWEKIRDDLLRLESMRYKFRYAEQIYQEKKLQRTTPN